MVVSKEILTFIVIAICALLVLALYLAIRVVKERKNTKEFMLYAGLYENFSEKLKNDIKELETAIKQYEAEITELKGKQDGNEYHF